MRSPDAATAEGPRANIQQSARGLTQVRIRTRKMGMRRTSEHDVIERAQEKEIQFGQLSLSFYFRIFALSSYTSDTTHASRAMSE